MVRSCIVSYGGRERGPQHPALSPCLTRKELKSVISVILGKNAPRDFSLLRSLLVLSEATNGSHGLVVLLSLGDKVHHGLDRDLLTRDMDRSELWEPGRASGGLKI